MISDGGDFVAVLGTMGALWLIFNAADRVYGVESPVPRVVPFAPTSCAYFMKVLCQ